MAGKTFDDMARGFAQFTDAMIAQKTYPRGDIFVRATKRAVPAHGRVLDYGCGPGRLARLIAEQGYRVHGIDPSPAMIAEANGQQLGGLEAVFEVSSTSGAQLISNSYDGIVCSSVIEYVPDPEALLSDFHRWLRPGGSLIISFANQASLWGNLSRWRSRETAPYLKLQCNFYTSGSFGALLKQAHFSTISATEFFEAAPLDKMYLSFFTRFPLVGTLGLVVSRRDDG